MVVGCGVCMVRWPPPFHVCVHVLLAPPSVLGAQSMVLDSWCYGCNLSVNINIHPRYACTVRVAVVVLCVYVPVCRQLSLCYRLRRGV